MNSTTSVDELDAVGFCMSDFDTEFDEETDIYIAECELDQLVALQPEQLGAGCRPLPIHFRKVYGIEIPF